MFGVYANAAMAVLDKRRHARAASPMPTRTQRLGHAPTNGVGVLVARRRARFSPAGELLSEAIRNADDL
jgi:hypothetical protein